PIDLKEESYRADWLASELLTMSLKGWLFISEQFFDLVSLPVVGAPSPLRGAHIFNRGNSFSLDAGSVPVGLPPSGSVPVASPSTSQEQEQAQRWNS
ncbi:MAG TPA: hypothetical protein PLY96_14030, partial [Chromatiaceae bacterium]|nr:hypothetical protein [Chromatiaceae bacterium]